MITLTQFQQDIAEQQRRRAAVAAGLPADPPGTPDAAVAAKARKPGKRGRRDGEAATMAHEMAEGAMEGAGGEREHGDTGKACYGPGVAPWGGEHLRPGEPPRGPDFRRPPITEGHAALSPGHEPPNAAPVPEGQPAAQDFHRGYLSPGHAADSPANSPAHIPHVDMSGSRGVMRAISPSAPMGPGGAR